MSNIYKNRYEDLLQGVDSISPDAKFGENVRIGRGVVIESGCVIGNNVIIGHGVVLRPNTIIGNDSVIAHGCVCEGDATIGNRVLIQAQCHLTKGILIKDDVFLGTSVVTTNTDRIVHGRKIPLYLDAPIIRRAARIGSGACLRPGVVIGSNAMVGLGSLVTKDVPNGEIWFGNPAMFHRLVPVEELL